MAEYLNDGMDRSKLQSLVLRFAQKWVEQGSPIAWDVNKFLAATEGYSPYFRLAVIIKAWMILRGDLTQNQAGGILGVTGSTAGKWLVGASKIEPEHLRGKVAPTLGLPPDRLEMLMGLRESTDSNEPSLSEDQVIAAAVNLSPQALTEKLLPALVSRISKLIANPQQPSTEPIPAAPRYPDLVPATVAEFLLSTKKPLDQLAEDALLPASRISELVSGDAVRPSEVALLSDALKVDKSALQRLAATQNKIYDSHYQMIGGEGQDITWSNGKFSLFIKSVFEAEGLDPQADFDKLLKEYPHSDNKERVQRLKGIVDGEIEPDYLELGSIGLALTGLTQGKTIYNKDNLEPIACPGLLLK